MLKLFDIMKINMKVPHKSQSLFDSTKQSFINIIHWTVVSTLHKNQSFN